MPGELGCTDEYKPSPFHHKMHSVVGDTVYQIIEHCGVVCEVGIQVEGKGERSCFTVLEQEIVLETFLSVAAVFRASEKMCLGKFSGISRVPPGPRSSPEWFPVVWNWHRGSKARISLLWLL